MLHTLLAILFETHRIPNFSFLDYDEVKCQTNVTNLYDKWNTQDIPAGDCTYGSGQNQMTMTYETFTGWLSYGGC